MSTESGPNQLTLDDSGKPFTLRYVCRECGHVIEMAIQEGMSKKVSCEECQHEFPGFFNDEAARTRRLDRCLICGNEELYVRKDFRQQTGAFFVVFAVVLATIVYAFDKNMLWPIVILLVTAVIDAVLYRLIDDLETCYQCKAEYRGMVRHPDHKPYSHYTAERYRARAET